MSLQNDIQTIRSQFPALSRMHQGRNVIYFDGPGGTQILNSALDAMNQYWKNGSANVHGQFPTSKELEEIVVAAKNSLGDMLACKANEIAFGANATSMIFSVSRSLSRTWKKGDEIVLSEIDHHANIDTWLLAALDKGVTVRWLTVDPQSLTLDLTRLQDVITDKTVLVATSYASNAVGTINDIPKIAARAHEVGAVMAVDAVHIAPHKAIDMNTLGADVLFCSAYKFFGGHIGIAALKEEVFNAVEAYKLSPAPNKMPGKFETGTQSHEAIASIIPAIEFVRNLGQGNNNREKIISGFSMIEAYENSLAENIRLELSKISQITMHQSPHMCPKTATIAFTVENCSPELACKKLADEYGIFAANGDFYATTLAKKCNIQNNGGWIRIGLAPYNTEAEAEYFMRAISIIAKK